MTETYNAPSAEPSDPQQLRIINHALSAENSTLKNQIDVLRRSSSELDHFRRIVERIAAEKSRIEADLDNLQNELHRTTKEQQDLRVRLNELESEAAHYSALYVDAEQQNTNLTSLYVASHHLHSSVKREDVLARIQEIIINIIGSEELAVFQVDAATSSLRLAVSFGIDEELYRSVPMTVGIIGHTARTGELFVASPDFRPELTSETHLKACIPLKLDEQVTGVIAIFRLLQQKDGFGSVDYDLFELLSNHAAVALYTASLHARMPAGWM